MPEQRQVFQRQLDEIGAKVIELLDLVAADLARAAFLLCVLRILPKLERSHHLVRRLASRTSHIHRQDLSPATGN